jgi:hypothetical protein
VATCSSAVIVVKAVDYHKAMKQRAAALRKHCVEALSEHLSFAKKWTHSKIQALASHLTRRTYAKGEVRVCALLTRHAVTSSIPDTSSIEEQCSLVLLLGTHCRAMLVIAVRVTYISIKAHPQSVV